MSVQISITMAAKPNHRASALLQAALEEVKKLLKAYEIPEVVISQRNAHQRMHDRLSARGSVEVAQRLSKLQWKVEYIFR